VESAAILGRVVRGGQSSSSATRCRREYAPINENNRAQEGHRRSREAAGERGRPEEAGDGLAASLAEFVFEGLHVENRLNKATKGGETSFSADRLLRPQSRRVGRVKRVPPIRSMRPFGPSRFFHHRVTESTARPIRNQTKRHVRLGRLGLPGLNRPTRGHAFRLVAAIGRAVLSMTLW